MYRSGKDMFSTFKKIDNYLQKKRHNLNSVTISRHEKRVHESSVSDNSSRKKRVRFMRKRRTNILRSTFLHWVYLTYKKTGVFESDQEDSFEPLLYQNTKPRSAQGPRPSDDLSPFNHERRSDRLPKSRFSTRPYRVPSEINLPASKFPVFDKEDISFNEAVDYHDNIQKEWNSMKSERHHSTKESKNYQKPSEPPQQNGKLSFSGNMPVFDYFQDSYEHTLKLFSEYFAKKEKKANNKRKNSRSPGTPFGRRSPPRSYFSRSPPKRRIGRSPKLNFQSRSPFSMRYSPGRNSRPIKKSPQNAKIAQYFQLFSHNDKSIPKHFSFKTLKFVDNEKKRSKYDPPSPRKESNFGNFEKHQKIEQQEKRYPQKVTKFRNFVSFSDEDDKKVPSDFDYPMNLKSSSSEGKFGENKENDSVENQQKEGSEYWEQQIDSLHQQMIQISRRNIPALVVSDDEKVLEKNDQEQASDVNDLPEKSDSDISSDDLSPHLNELNVLDEPKSPNELISGQDENAEIDPQ